MKTTKRIQLKDENYHIRSYQWSSNNNISKIVEMTQEKKFEKELARKKTILAAQAMGTMDYEAMKIKKI